ncbi:MAG: DUF3987 domain-containing protein [Limisphaerales bacterium]
MKTYNPLESKSAGGLPATPRETKTVDTSTITTNTTPAQADSGPPDLEPGEFPLHALSPTLRAIAQDLAHVHRVPVQLPAMCAVGIVSGALGNAFTLTGAVDGQVCHGNLYVIPAAPKSSGKGSVANALVRPLLEASGELEVAFKQRQLPKLRTDKAILEKSVGIMVNALASGQTGRGKEKQPMGEAQKDKTRRELDAAHAELERIAPLVDAMPTYYVGNATSEAMAAQFKRNNLGLFCYSAEAGETVRVLMGKYRGDGKADYDLALSGYSVEPWRSDRIGRGVCQITPCLAMLLLVQPCILRELMGDEEAFERGLTARTLPFIVETEPLEDDGLTRRVSEQAEAAWSHLIRNILARRDALAGNPHRIVCTLEAREVFRQFHNESVRLRRGGFRDIEAELGRWRENAVRLGIGLCVADNLEAHEITGEQASRAVEIMRWCARSALQVTNAARMDKRGKRADELHVLLAGKSGGKETVRNLEKSHGFKPEEVHTLAWQFPERFTVERVETGGRPSEVLRLAQLARC